MNRNDIMGKVIMGKAVLMCAFFSLATTAQALPTHEVIFEQGSSCGHYKGDLTGSSIFILELRADQQLMVRTDGHVQSVTDNKGTVLADQGGANYRYVAINSGTHQVKMAGRSSSSAEFCID